MGSTRSTNIVPSLIASSLAFFVAGCFIAQYRWFALFSLLAWIIPFGFVVYLFTIGVYQPYIVQKIEIIVFYIILISVNVSAIAALAKAGLSYSRLTVALIVLLALMAINDVFFVFYATHLKKFCVRFRCADELFFYMENDEQRKARIRFGVYTDDESEYLSQCKEELSTDLIVDALTSYTFAVWLSERHGDDQQKVMMMVKNSSDIHQFYSTESADKPKTD